MPRGAGERAAPRETELFATGLEKKAERFVSTSSFLSLAQRQRERQYFCRHSNDIPRWLARRRRACLRPWSAHQPGIERCSRPCPLRLQERTPRHRLTLFYPKVTGFRASVAGRWVQTLREPARTKPRR